MLLLRQKRRRGRGQLTKQTAAREELWSRLSCLMSNKLHTSLQFTLTGDDSTEETESGRKIQTDLQAHKLKFIGLKVLRQQRDGMMIKCQLNIEFELWICKQIEQRGVNVIIHVQPAHL